MRQALKRECEGENRLFQPNGLLTERDHRRMTRGDWRSPFDLPERGVLIPKLAQLAHAMQTRRKATDGAQIRIDFEDACDLLEDGHDEDILRAGLALNVLDEDATREEILFFHQLLQEYFAARKLAGQPDPEKVRLEWQADRVTPRLDETIQTLADNDPLPPLPATGWEETTVLAAALSADSEAFVRGLMDVNLPLAARAATAPEVVVSESLKHEHPAGADRSNRGRERRPAGAD